MNDEMRTSPVDILNDAFSPKKNGEPTTKGYDHPHEETIISGAKRILSYSATGQALLDFVESKGLKIKILKDSSSSGYIPSSDIAIITCPSNQTKVTPKTVLDFIHAFREAEQEDRGFSRPDPRMSEEEYVKKDMQKQEDIFVTKFYVSYELFKNAQIKDLLDEMSKDGNKPYIDQYINHMETNS